MTSATVFGFIAACCLALAFGDLQTCVTPGAQTISDGTETAEGVTVFRCNQGTLNAVGCVHTENNNVRVPVGERVKTDGYEMTCIQLTPTTTHLKATACVYEHKTYAPTQTVDSGYFSYTCVATENGVALEVTACLDLAGNRVHPGGEVIRDDYLFRCTLQAGKGGVTLEPVACLYGGVAHAMGEVFEGDTYWFQCTKGPTNSISRQAQGCMNQGKRIGEGEKFYKNAYAFVCERTTDGFTTRCVACLEETGNGVVVEHPIGSEWFQGPAPFRFVVTCRKCPNGFTIIKSLDKCSYGKWGKEGGINVGPGCMIQYKDLVVKCGVYSDGLLQVYTDFYSTEAVDRARKEGYRTC